MKKNCTAFSAIFLILSILLLTAGCNGKPGASPTDTVQPVAPTPAPEETMPVEVPDFSISDESVAALNALVPVYDSLMRALRDQPADWPHYSSTSEDFFWSTLYYLCVNYGAEDSRNQMDDATILVPRAVVEEYAAACFYDYGELFALPQSDTGISFDEAKDAYIFVLSDKGDDYIDPIRFDYTINDEYEVCVAWLSVDEEYPDMLGAYSFSVAPNQYNVRNSIANPRFTYCVRYAVEVTTDLVLVTDTYEKDGKRYAVLDPVFIRHHGALDLNEDGEPYGYEWEEIVNDTVESLEYMLSDLAEFDFTDLDFLLEDINFEDATTDAVQFFMDNAKRQFEGQHLAFQVNLYKGILYYGKFTSESYSVG